MARFSALKNHGTKIYKFNQGKSLFTFFGAVPDPLYASIKNGVCAALTVDWLSEKLNRPWTLQFAGDFSGRLLHSGKNRDIVERNISRHVGYKKRGLNGKAWLFKKAGLHDCSLTGPLFGPAVSFGQGWIRSSSSSRRAAGCTSPSR